METTSNRFGKKRKLRHLFSRYPELSAEDIDYLLDMIREQKFHLIDNHRDPNVERNREMYAERLNQLKRIERQLICHNSRPFNLQEVKRFFEQLL